MEINTSKNVGEVRQDMEFEGYVKGKVIKERAAETILL